MDNSRGSEVRGRARRADPKSGARADHPGHARAVPAAVSLGEVRRRLEIEQAANGFILWDSEGDATHLVADHDGFRAVASLLTELCIRLGTSYWDFDDQWVNVRLERGERWYRENQASCPHDLGAYLPAIARWVCICGLAFAPEPRRDASGAPHPSKPHEGARAARPLEEGR